MDYFGASGAIMWSPFIICFFMWVFFIGAIWSPDMWSAVVASGLGGVFGPRDIGEGDGAEGDACGRGN